ncbi:MAG: nucleotide exchange factor GrpE [Candidatus Cloacimonadota bacterium]|nr:MAG: nucleotide exchange factor GrpE [Candidatus Cloacimonadota bacterium]PIE77797.1 MAG: nucleotide exchange factor GrpE [Candidatus Delongbacteria bacterium]
MGNGMSEEKLNNEDVEINESETEKKLDSENSDQEISSEDLSKEEEKTEEEIEESKEPSEDNKEESEEVVDKDSQIMEFRDKLLRKVAEFENYKKRTSQEFVRLVESANQDLILKLLPVKDDIDRFNKNYNEEHGVKELKKGVDMIFEKFNSILKKFGLEELEAIGEQFDPELHEALLQIDSEDVDSNTVVDQHEKGYKLKEKVIRHAKVIVSK